MFCEVPVDAGAATFLAQSNGQGLPGEALVAIFLANHKPQTRNWSLPGPGLW